MLAQYGKHPQESSMAMIYHNPRCGISRNVPQFLQERGEPVQVIEYLDQPLDRHALGEDET